LPVSVTPILPLSPPPPLTHAAPSAYCVRCRRHAGTSPPRASRCCSACRACATCADHVCERWTSGRSAYHSRGRVSPCQVALAASTRERTQSLRFVTDNVAGYWAARWYLKEKHVTAVVGLGGAASASTVRAAISRGLPVVLLEQNVVPGRMTRWLARSAN